MNIKTGIFIIVLVIAGLLAYLYATNEIGPNAPRVQQHSVSAEYGSCPQRITNIMAGDGQALTDEVNEQRRPSPAPVLTERRDRR